MSIYFNGGHFVSKFSRRIIKIVALSLLNQIGPNFKDHQIDANYKHDNFNL